MSSLSDHWNDAPFLETGWHEVRITAVREFTAASGSYGIEFELTDTHGRKTKTQGFYPETKGIGFLIEFLKAAQVTQEQVRNVAANANGLRNVVMNKRLRVYVEKPEGDKYHRVTGYEKLVIGSGAPVKPAQETVPASVLAAADLPPQEHFDTDQLDDQPPPMTEDESIPTGDQIPF